MQSCHRYVAITQNAYFSSNPTGEFFRIEHPDVRLASAAGSAHKPLWKHQHPTHRKGFGRRFAEQASDRGSLRSALYYRLGIGRSAGDLYAFAVEVQGPGVVRFAPGLGLDNKDTLTANNHVIDIASIIRNVMKHLGTMPLQLIEELCDGALAIPSLPQ